MRYVEQNHTCFYHFSGPPLLHSVVEEKTVNIALRVRVGNGLESEFAVLRWKKRQKLRNLTSLQLLVSPLRHVPGINAAACSKYINPGAGVSPLAASVGVRNVTL